MWQKDSKLFPMNADRWQRVEDCYHAAMERPPGERAAFLAQACAHDPELRREVESLLAHEGQADGLLERPVWDNVASSDETGTIAPAALEAGSLLAGYRIAGKLGAGGMGEVYRATDTKLHREVALKVLAPRFAHNPQWMSRFQREARVLASLNHPHIAAIYGLEESGSVRAIAMELVEGLTLAERIERKPIPIKEALALARQIAEALEYAHEKGIVHRDLKPANVKLRSDSVAKVLDFGLAKAVSPDEEPAATDTRTGMILGTPAYMAPEQAAGTRVDRRVDIWAFGVVLFEMLTGRKMYGRKTTAETLAAIARDEPRWDELPAETPAAIVRMLRRCLDKDPKRRLQAIGEARIALEEDQPEEIAGAASARRLRRSAWAAWSLAAVAMLALAVLVWQRPSAAPVLTGVLMGGPEVSQSPRPSPDGHMVAFWATIGDNSQVGVMKPETGDSLILTHSTENGWTQNLSWSPDGSRIYYDRSMDLPRGIYSVPVLGGKEQLVIEDAFAPEALPDGSLLLAKFNAERQLQLFRYWPETGRLTGFPAQMDFDTAAIRSFPDGRQAVIIGKPIGSGSEAGTHVYAVDLASGKVRRIVSGLSDDSTLSAIAVTRDGRSVLIAGVAGILSRVQSVPGGGRGQPHLVLTLTAKVYELDAGPDGAIYLDQAERPANVLRFRVSGGRAEKIATLPAYEDRPFAVLPDGRIVIQETSAGHTRLMAVEPGKDPVPMVNTSEDTRGPVAAAGDQMAFFIGSEPSRAIAMATTADGRITRRIPFAKGAATALAAAPDRMTLYCAADGVVWSLPVSGGEPHRIRAGDYIAVDPQGQYLLVEAPEGPGIRLVRVPLQGGMEQVIPLAPGPRPASHITANAVGTDGRILSPLGSPSYYWLPGLIDPSTGVATRIPVDDITDYHALAWAPDGYVIGIGLGTRSKMWKFTPEGRR